jgi:hypothetical protein
MNTRDYSLRCSALALYDAFRQIIRVLHDAPARHDAILIMSYPRGLVLLAATDGARTHWAAVEASGASGVGPATAAIPGDAAREYLLEPIYLPMYAVFQWGQQGGSLGRVGQSRIAWSQTPDPPAIAHLPPTLPVPIDDGPVIILREPWYRVACAARVLGAPTFRLGIDASHGAYAHAVAPDGVRADYTLPVHELVDVTGPWHVHVSPHALADALAAGEAHARTALRYAPDASVALATGPYHGAILASMQPTT